jgi:hypothetical protein
MALAPSAPGCDDEESYQVAFTTADPAELIESGWGAGRIIGPDALPRPSIASLA